MSNQTLVLTNQETKTIASILEEMMTYENSLRALRQKLLMVLPEGVLRYGSQLWWERENYLVEEDIKCGRVSKPYTSVDELINDLHQGKIAR